MSDNDLIRRTDAIKAIKDDLDLVDWSDIDWGLKCSCIRRAAFKVECVPAVDAVEVWHGQWIWDEENYEHICSSCRMSFDYDKTYELFDHCFQYASYCPNCGARMDGRR